MNPSNSMETFRMSSRLTTLPEDSPGFEPFHAMDSSMRAWEYHSHDFYELYIHVKGAQYFCVDSDRYELSPDVFILIPPFCMHGLAQSGEMKGYERAWLNLSPELLSKLGCGQVDLPALFRSYTSRGHHLFQMTRKETDTCVALMDQLQVMAHSLSALDRFQCCSLIVSYLSVLCDVITRAAPLPASPVNNHIIQQILTYINENYTHPLSIRDLSQRFGISASYLSHEFAQYTRRSVYDYILYRRIVLARELIATPASLNTIAYECGFNDYSNFLRSFNKLVGMSPREYRELRRRQMIGSE